MFNLMKARVNIRGEQAQQNRMIKDKKRSLDYGIKYSYQAAKVQDIDALIEQAALINPDKNKQDYDDKIISIDFNSNFTTGTVFEWLNTNTKWLIYLQDLTELAYFRGNIRKCNYSISWVDQNGQQQNTFAAIRGPVETKINSKIHSHYTYDVPNYSLHILMPKNEQTITYFKRYIRFYLSGLEDYEEKTCWQVETTDSISTPGILEITATEYYQNDITDNIEEGLANVYPLQEKIAEEQKENLIQGPVFIKPKYKYSYEYIGEELNEWNYDTTLPIKIISKENKKIVLQWTAIYSGQFDLSFGNTVKTIIVESFY